MRKQKWKKVLSAVVAASMILSMTPVDASASSAQDTPKAVSGSRAAQSIEDVLDQAVSDDSGTIFGTGITSWYFSEAIEGVVDAGTLYLKGTEGTETIKTSAASSWASANEDKPIKSLIIKNVQEVGQSAFWNASQMTTLKLEGVTAIKASAFSSCSLLSKVDLGEALTTIDSYAFNGCKSLAHIRIPAGVTRIMDNVFQNCTDLQDVAICTTAEQPEQGTATNINFATNSSLICVKDGGRGGMYHPFIGCSNFTVYVAERNNGIEKAMNFVYGEAVGGSYTSTTSITSVKYTISTLDKYDAKKEAEGELVIECPDVQQGELPAPVITKNETGIDGSNVQWLYYKSANGSSAIEPEDLTETVGTYYVQAVLQDDTHFALKSVIVPFQVTPEYTYTIEDGVLKIAPRPGIDECAMIDYGQYSWGSDPLAPWKDEEYTSVEIADGITSVGAYAFYEGKKLTSVKLGKDVTSIGRGAFYNSGLESIDLSETAVTSIARDAFSQCKNLTEAILPEDITTLEQSIFNGCSALTEITLPETVTEIGENAFTGCTNLASISLPEGLETIGRRAFSACSSLAVVEGLEKTKITQLRGAFEDCSSLSNVQVPPTVETLDAAFLRCTNLQNAIIQVNGALTLTSWPFYDCTSLENVLLSATKVTIDSMSFQNCSAMKKMTIKGVTGEAGSELTISAASAFNGVSATIYVPNEKVQTAVRTALASVDAYADDADMELDEQKIRVITEGDDSDIKVRENSRLVIALDKTEYESGEDITPSVSEKVGDGDITYWYYKLQDRKYVLVDKENPGKVPAQAGTYYVEGRMADTESYFGCRSNMISFTKTGQYSGDDFEYNTKTGVLVLKADVSTGTLSGMFPDYKETVTQVSWAESDTTYQMVPDFADCTSLVKVTGIPVIYNPYSNNYKGCTSLTEVTFAEDFVGTRMDGPVFMGCTSLEEIVIPDSVQVLSVGAGTDKGVFQGCTSLKKVVFGSGTSVRSIGYCAFLGCTSLTAIDIPAKVTEIGNHAFNGCTALKEVNFLVDDSDNGSLGRIGDSAFANCISLEEFVLPRCVSGNGKAAGTNLDKNAFAGCSSLTSFVFGSVGGIGAGAFKDCVKLNDVQFYLPTVADDSGKYTIDTGAFENAGTSADSFVVTIPATMNPTNGFKGSGITELIWESGTYQSASRTQISENALAGCSRLKKVTLKKADYTEEQVPGITSKNFADGCPADLVIYAIGNTYDLLAENGYTKAVDYQTIVDGKVASFGVLEGVFEGLDASLYGEDVLTGFQEDALAMAKATVEESTGDNTTLSVFEQEEIIDETVAFLMDAYFGEGGLAEVAAQAAADLTKGLDETEYTADSWKALTDAQAAVADFMKEEAATADVSKVTVFEGLVKAAKNVKLLKKGETPAPGDETPAPGQDDTPAPGQDDTPAPGQDDTPAPGQDDTPAPGQDNTPAPGQNNTPAPGQNNTPAPGQNNTPTPGQIDTPAPDQPQVVAAAKVSKVTAKKKAAVVKWKKVAGANGYQIAYGTKKNFKGAKKVTVKGNKASYTIKKLKKGKVYYIRIRAYQDASGKKVYGKWSGAKKVKIKK